MSDGQNEFGPGLQTLNGRGRGILTLRRVGNKMGRANARPFESRVREGA